jgi:hypothetical protein
VVGLCLGCREQLREGGHRGGDAGRTKVHQWGSAVQLAAPTVQTMTLSKVGATTMAVTLYKGGVGGGGAGGADMDIAPVVQTTTHWSYGGRLHLSWGMPPLLPLGGCGCGCGGGGGGGGDKTAASARG